MKTIKRITLSTFAFLSLISPALAESAVRQDDSNVLVWTFLGACALIIILQMVPVITMAFGLIKGVTGEEDSELEPAPSKYQ